MQGVQARRRESVQGRQRGTATWETDCRGPLQVIGRPPDIAAVLRSADEATRAEMVGDLQRRFGNAVVSRLVDPALDTRPQVQRYAVRLPAGTSDCMVVVNWLNSPHVTSSVP